MTTPATSWLHCRRSQLRLLVWSSAVTTVSLHPVAVDAPVSTPVRDTLSMSLGR